MQKVLSGFIRKRNEKYHVYVEYLNEEGKKKQRSEGSCKTKKEAEKLLIEVKNNINKDKYIIPKNISFVQRCNKYYDDKINELAETTVYSSKNIIKKHIEPYWMDIKLADITINSYQKYVNYIFYSDIPSNSKKRIISITNAVLNECYKYREIQNKISDFIKIPKTNKTNEVEIYSIDEIKFILEKAKYKFPAFEIALNLFVYGGLRCGEALGLCWENVNFEDNTITIKNNLQYVKNEFIMRTTKTQSSVRSISLPVTIMNLLKAEKLRQNKLKIQGLMLKKEYDTVCISQNTNYYNPRAFRESYKKFINDIGLEYKKPHALRHAHVSMLIASGIDVKTISARVGHSNIDITLEIYAHVFKENDKKAADKIDNILSQ